MWKEFKKFMGDPIVGQNTPLNILGLFLSILIAWIAGRILKYALKRAADRFKEKELPVTATALNALSQTSVFFLLAVGLKVGIGFLAPDPRVTAFTKPVTSVLIAAAVGWALWRLVDVIQAWLERLTARSATKLDDMLVPLVRKSLRVTIVILVLVQIAQILSDKPLTSIIAGLGVTGLAIALAAQDTIKNFFGSVVIFSDQPFQVGDRIVVDGHDGPVEEVGFRSTRIRTLEGHVVTIPNGELANKTILNIGKRPYIRRLFNITITYDTPPEKVRRALEILRELLKDHEGMRPEFPPRVYFNGFNDCSLNIMVIYWYHPPNYWDFCAFNERVNMEILRRFNEEGIEFAFPTQTLFVAGDPKRPFDTSGVGGSGGGA